MILSAVRSESKKHFRIAVVVAGGDDPGGTIVPLRDLPASAPPATDAVVTVSVDSNQIAGEMLLISGGLHYITGQRVSNRRERKYENEIVCRHA